MILKSIVANTPPRFSTMPRPRLQLCGFLATNKFLYDYDNKKSPAPRSTEPKLPNHTTIFHEWAKVLCDRKRQSMRQPSRKSTEVPNECQPCQNIL